MIFQILQNVVFSLEDLLGDSRKEQKRVQVLRYQISSWKFMPRLYWDTKKILSKSRSQAKNLALSVKHNVILSCIDFKECSVHGKVSLQCCRYIQIYLSVFYEPILISNEWKEISFYVGTFSSIDKLFHWFIMNSAEVRRHEFVYFWNFLEILAKKPKEIRCFFIFFANYFSNALS